MDLMPDVRLDSRSNIMLCQLSTFDTVCLCVLLIFRQKYGDGCTFPDSWVLSHLSCSYFLPVARVGLAAWPCLSSPAHNSLEERVPFTHSLMVSST